MTTKEKAKYIVRDILEEKSTDPGRIFRRQTKFLFVVRRNESDASFCFLQMLFKPGPIVGITVEIIISLPPVQPKEVTVLLCVCTKSEVREIVGSKGALRMGMAVSVQRRSVFQDSSKSRIVTQRMDYCIELGLEFIRFQICTMICPAGKEAIPIKVHITAKVADQASLRFNLTAL